MLSSGPVFLFCVGLLRLAVILCVSGFGCHDERRKVERMSTVVDGEEWDKKGVAEGGIAVSRIWIAEWIA